MDRATTKKISSTDYPRSAERVEQLTPSAADHYEANVEQLTASTADQLLRRSRARRSRKRRSNAHEAVATQRREEHATRRRAEQSNTPTVADDRQVPAALTEVVVSVWATHARGSKKPNEALPSFSKGGQKREQHAKCPTKSMDP